MANLLISGWCHSGAHEGQIKMSERGVRFPTCSGNIGRHHKCPCWCHEVYRKAAKLMAERGEELPSTRPAPVASATVEPSLDPTGGHSTPDEKQAARMDPSGSPNNAITDIPPPDFNPTPTGRKAHGELEQQVLEACDKWVKMGSPGLLVPSLIAKIIDPDNLPSTGAIAAVLGRWAELGFAVMGQKPIRFVGYSEEGETLGLWVMKSRDRASKKKVARTVRRGF